MRTTRLVLVALVTQLGAGALAAPAAWQRIGSRHEARQYFTKPSTRLQMLAGLKRAQVYWPYAQPAARQHGVPEDLFFGLALCESAFNPYARSYAGAEGMFQFMPSTGRLYGLQSRRDRRNISKSSQASARLLRDLYRRFGSWDLALAAYNAGSGNVRRAMKRADSSRWSKVRLHLPAQTYSYVPKVRYLASEMYPRVLRGEVGASFRLERVQRGDTWTRLADRHEVPLQVLRQVNGNALYAGAVLVVPEPGLVRELAEESTNG